MMHGTINIKYMFSIFSRVFFYSLLAPKALLLGMLFKLYSLYSRQL